MFLFRGTPNVRVLTGSLDSYTILVPEGSVETRTFVSEPRGPLSVAVDLRLKLNK